MRRSIHPDPGRPRVRLPRELLAEVCAHALETYPEECCGLVVGSAEDPYRRVVRCRNDLTAHHRRDPRRFPRDGTQGFHMNEYDYLTAQQQAEERGERVTVVYHSHVECGAYFSELDQEFAERELFPFPEAEHLVLGVIEGRVREVALFRRGEDGGFVGHPVVLEP